MGAYSQPVAKGEATKKRESTVAAPVAESEAKRTKLPSIDSDDDEQQLGTNGSSRDQDDDNWRPATKVAKTQTTTPTSSKPAKLPSKPRLLVPPQVRRGVPNRSTEDVKDLFTSPATKSK